MNFKKLSCPEWIFIQFRFNLISFFEFSAAASTIEGKMSKSLKKLLKKLFVEDTQETLAVADAKLGNVIKVRF